MLIQSLKSHFPARALEWYGAGVMFSWGFYVLTHPQIFTNPETAKLFAGLVQVAEFFGQRPEFIGLMALMTGVFRAVALFVNGAVSKTPLIRLLTAFASAYIWATILIGFTIINTATTGLVIYAWLLLADIVSGYRAGYDLVIAENVAKTRSLNNGQRHNGSERRRIFGFLAQ